MTAGMPLTFLCIATYRKGDEFLRECDRQGCRVLLLTDEKLREADWPREAIDAFYYIRRDMPEADIRKGAAHLARTERIDRIVALDDFDVELAAMLREYLHIAGMGETTARAFRDKLAMRNRAQAAGIPCPEFVHVLNQETVDAWTSRVPPPWVMKPRSQAAAIGIRKLHSREELAQATEGLGDDYGEVLLEQFVTGAVYHVDSIVFDRRVRFAVASRYRTPPMAVAHEGGIFVTQTLDEGDPASTALRGPERSRPRCLRSAARRIPHRVHSGNRRRVVLSRNLRACRRCVHRRRRRGGDGNQSVERVGESRNRRGKRELRSASGAAALSRDHPVARASGTSRHGGLR